MVSCGQYSNPEVSPNNGGWTINDGKLDFKQFIADSITKSSRHSPDNNSCLERSVRFKHFIQNGVLLSDVVVNFSSFFVFVFCNFRFSLCLNCSSLLCKNLKRSLEHKPSWIPPILRKRNNVENWKMVLLSLALITSIVILTPCDSRSAKNRQRNHNFKPMVYKSQQEKEAFNKLRSLEDTESKLNSHLSFFKSCLNRGVFPKNLLGSQHFQIACPDLNFSNKMKELDAEEATFFQSYNRVKTITQQAHYVE